MIRQNYAEIQLFELKIAVAGGQLKVVFVGRPLSVAGRQCSDNSFPPNFVPVYESI